MLRRPGAGRDYILVPKSRPLLTGFSPISRRGQIDNSRVFVGLG